MLYFQLNEAMGFCSLISWGLDLVRSGSTRPPVLSKVMLVSEENTDSLRSLAAHLWSAGVPCRQISSCG